MERNFIGTKRGAFSGWIGYIYRYSADGRTEERLWTSGNCETKEEAIDATVEYADANNIEIESIDF